VITLRRAVPADADWLVELYGDEDVEPFMGPRAARGRDAIVEEIEIGRAHV